MSSLFRKPKKNLRQRIAADSDEETEGVISSQPVAVKLENNAATSSSKSKTQSSATTGSIDSSKKKQSSILSFQEDLEGDDGIETFQIKKSSQSRRIAKRLEKERKQKEQEQKTFPSTTATSGEDTATSRKENSTPTPPESGPQQLILNGRDAEMAGYHSNSDEDEGSENEGVRFRRPEPFRRVLESGVIPDAALIHAARKHRQQAREMGEADFIKVDGMPEHDNSQVSTARLVREDEHDKSDEDEAEDGRVDFSVDLQTKDKQKRREAFLAAEQEEVHELSDEAEDNDDEMDKWERQQFQKAIRQRQVELTHQDMSFQQHIAVGLSSEINSSRTSSPSMTGTPDASVKGPSAIPSRAKAPPDLTKLAPLPTPEELQAKLRDRLTSLEEVHRRNVNNLERSKTDLSTCYNEVERLKKEQPRLSNRFHFFQVTRGYIHDLVDCATTKFGEVQVLEKRWTTLLARRYRLLTERRRNDVRDEAGDCATQGIDPLKGDNQEKISRTAEREARRRRRRLGRKDSRHKEGLSSDDEVSDKDAMNFTSEKEKIQRESSQLFSDALDEFRSVEAITERFDEWRSKEIDSYREAYVELFLPRILTCVIRAQFLEDAWNPLEHEMAYIKKSDWFQILVQYDLGSKDSSLLVISKTIELSVVPLVTEVIKASYDPCSTNQTNRLVTLVKTLTDEHPSLASPNKAMQLMLSAVTEKFENAVDQDVFIPFHFAAKSSTFVNRQFWSASKLLRNILHWQSLVEDSVLQAMALDKLFRRYMLIAFKSQYVKNDPDTLDKVAYISAALPKHWLGPMAANAPQLQPLIEVVMSLAQNADCTTVLGKKQIENVAHVLRALGAGAEAQEILSKYL